jgi:hypothetical protein
MYLPYRYHLIRLQEIFLSGMSKSLLGLDGLALIHSLPFALLIWG